MTARSFSLLRLAAGLALAGLCAHVPAVRAQEVLTAPGGGQIRALIIGIDHYRHVNQLRGALADADDLASTLGRLGVADITQLRDEAVTRAAMLANFEALLARAQPGDLVFLSLAGHGAQEPERVKGSQPDGLDAIFILTGFNPATPEGASEKIIDTEFNHYIKLFEEKGARVLFLADTCSGGGLARDVDPRAEPLTYRSITYRPIADNIQPVSTRADSLLSPIDFKDSSFLAAVDKQSKAPEVKVPGISGYRGALSYAVARSLEGAADENGDGKITAGEIFEYARQVTYQLTDQRQKIVTAAPERLDQTVVVIAELSRGIAVKALRPAAGEAAPGAVPPLQSTVASASSETPPLQPAPPKTEAAAPPPDKPEAAALTPPKTAALEAKAPEAAAEKPPQALKPREKPGKEFKQEPLRLALLGIDIAGLGDLPPGVPYQLVGAQGDPDLTWDAARKQVLARGDVIAGDIGRDELPGVMERMAAIRAVKQRAAAAPQRMRILPNDKLHHLGERVEVRVDNLKGRALVLFNIAGDGTVQQLFPAKPDAPVWTEPSYSVPYRVTAPFGADQLVAVTSAQPMPALDRAIRALHKRRSALKAVDVIRQNAPPDALIGTVGLYTAP